MTELDARWDWIELTQFGREASIWAKGRCRHLDVVPVESAGETAAHLCLTCGEQLPAEWRS